MCGIAGEIEYERPLSPAGAAAMQAALRRRGRTRRGFFLPRTPCWSTPGCASLTRKTGCSPCRPGSGARTCTLVYNGELYNTPELRAALLAAGWQFDGHSDTEVLLKAYLEWGEACVGRFNGIFAFAVWEQEAGHTVSGPGPDGGQAAVFHQDRQRRTAVRLRAQGAAGPSIGDGGSWTRAAWVS